MEGKKTFRKLRKIVFKNLGLKVISLVLAVVLWFLVIQIEDPQAEQSYENIQVKLVNTELLDNEDKFYEVLEDTDKVKVKVYAPRSIIEKLRKSDILAEADVSKLTDINTIAITYRVENATVDKIEGGHDVVRLNVEEKKTKWIRLLSNKVGEVADGYIVSNMTLDQNTIQITGPESVVNRVSYAQVYIDVEGATNSMSANVDIELYDENNQQIDQKNISKNVEYAYMEVEVLATKEVPIELSYTGKPEEGYMATGVVESDITSVTIAGTASALANANSIVVPAERLDITGQSENLVETISTKGYLPANTQLADKNFDGKITATVYVQPMVEKKLHVPVENLSIVNLPAGLVAGFAEDTTSVALQIQGLGEYVDPVRASAVTGYIDITSWMKRQNIEELAPGTYEMPVTFRLAEQIEEAETVTLPVMVSLYETESVVLP